jgi:hypothetical protein
MIPMVLGDPRRKAGFEAISSALLHPLTRLALSSLIAVHLRYRDTSVGNLSKSVCTVALSHVAYPRSWQGYSKMLG